MVFIHLRRDVNTISASPLGCRLKNILYSINIRKSYFSNKSLLVAGAPPCALNPYYITGFTDGEGCYFIGVHSDYNYKTGYRVKASFQIGLHEKDLALLKQIQSFFGVGKITRLGAESVQFRVTGLEDLNVIVNHFDNYPY